MIVRELLFATREAHILDAVSPAGRVMFWVLFNLFVVAMLCVDFMCADKSSGANRARFRAAALWTYVGCEFEEGFLIFPSSCLAGFSP